MTTDISLVVFLYPNRIYSGIVPPCGKLMLPQTFKGVKQRERQCRFLLPITFQNLLNMKGNETNESLGVVFFDNPQFGEIRTAMKDGEAIFCLGDVCKVLGLTTKKVIQRLEKEVLSKYPPFYQWWYSRNSICQRGWIVRYNL